MINLIIGKNSNLSQSLLSQLDDSILISTCNAIKELNKIELNKQKVINIIFNNFQKSSMLNDITLPHSYIYRSIASTSDILEYFKQNNIKINKIIYTSSSSVYGNNILCKETDMINPLGLHSALKIANEKLIEMFANDNNIDFVITRIFNMYGGDDSFSVISRIINSYKQKIDLNIINNGNAIRDFVCIDDVVKIYKILLNKQNIGILNIGTGTGKSIGNILDFLYNNNIIVSTQNINKNEIKISTANTTKLYEIIDDLEFACVNDYLLESLIQ
jgi:UDP-glucose 4-epimerase